MYRYGLAPARSRADPGWEGGGANIFFVYLRDYILARRHSTILKDHLKNVQGRTDPRGKGHRVQCVHVYCTICTHCHMIQKCTKIHMAPFALHSLKLSKSYVEEA